MTKKKSSSIQNAATATGPSSSHAPPTDDLKPLVHEHSLFFDHLVELIPSRFYLPTDDIEKPWYPGLSKAAKASARKESRENTKKARRERLDPERSASTLDALKKTIDAGKEENNAPETVVDRALTYEELRLRLRRRIEELRSTRNTTNPEKGEGRKDKKENEKDKPAKKRKRDDESKEKDVKKGNNKKLTAKEEKKDPSSVDLSFGKVKINESDKKGKGISKEEKLLRAQRLQEAKKDPDKGDVVSTKHSWKAAVSRAAGDKVHDDPKLLKESMKKEKKRRVKNAKKWKDRQKTVERAKAEKQKKREDNISEKRHQKKMRKIAKREKKLMNPGHAGRKQD